MTNLDPSCMTPLVIGLDPGPKRHKFNAQRTTLDGHAFASKAESHRYAELKLLEKAGEIESLELQPAFPLRVLLTTGTVRGALRAPGSLITLGFDGGIFHDSTALVGTDVKTGVPMDRRLVGMPIWRRQAGTAVAGADGRRRRDSENDVQPLHHPSLPRSRIWREESRARRLAEVRSHSRSMGRAVAGRGRAHQSALSTDSLGWRTHHREPPRARRRRDFRRQRHAGRRRCFT